MDLFTYLMARKGKKILPHKSDLCSYLLATHRIKIKEAQGTELNINAKLNNIVSLKMSKESTQDGTPTPENPVEVKTVKGYRNLFDKDNVVYVNGKILNDSGSEINDTNGGYTKMYIEVKANEYVTISGLPSAGTKRIYFFDSSKTFISRTEGFLSVTSITTQTPANCKYIDIQYNQTGNDFATYMVNEGNTVLPYVPYGTNWIYTTITDGTNTKYITLPLNDNEIAGIGDYKDEYIIDKNGHCWLNKKMGNATLDGSETSWVYTTSVFPYRIALTNKLILSGWNYDLICNYYKAQSEAHNYAIIAVPNSSSIAFRNTDITSLADFKTWLNTHNTIVWYPLDTPQLIDLNYNVDITLFKGTNNISNSDDMDMILKYY